MPSEQHVEPARAPMWSRFLDAGVVPSDTDEERASKRRLTLLAALFIPAGLVWGILYLSLGFTRSGLFPFGYGLASAAGFASFVVTKRRRGFAHTQCCLILLVPFLLQWSLGGFINGSAVMVWATLCPLGALTFLGLRPAIGWFIAFAFLCVVSGLVEPYLPPPDAVMPDASRRAFFVMNLLVTSAFAFVLVQHLTRMQRAAHEESERLLLNILPAAVAARLKRDQSAIAEGFGNVTILFADIVGFTELSARTSPERLVSLLNDIFSRFDHLADRFHLEKIKTIGDAYMVAGGIPTPREGHEQDVADMALAMREVVAEAALATGEPLRVRIGVHSGPVVAGVIGKRKFIYDLWGDAVNTASRMESHGVPSAIHVTDEIYRRLKDRFDFESRGSIAIKGKGEMQTYLLVGRHAETRSTS